MLAFNPTQCCEKCFMKGKLACPRSVYQLPEPLYEEVDSIGFELLVTQWAFHLQTSSDVI